MKMATRSGKTYQELKRGRKKNRKDIPFDISDIPKVMDGESNMDVSSTFTRSHRTRKSSAKDSSFDIDNVSTAKVDLEKATESNWIISNTSGKQKKKKLNKTSNGIIAKESENDLNVSNMPTKELRKKKLCIPNENYEEIDKEIINPYEKSAETIREIKLKKKKAKGKLSQESIDQRISLESANSHQKDTEPDPSSDVLGKQLKKKKKKVKNSKKKMLISKPVANDTDKEDIFETASEKEDANDLDSKQSNISARKKNDDTLNCSNVSKKALRNRKSSVKDITFDKEDNSMDTTYKQEQKRNNTFDKHSESDRINTSGDKTAENINVTCDKNNETYEKYVSTSFDTFKKGAMTRKSNVRDATFEKSDASFVSLTREELENDINVLASSAVKRKSGRRVTMDISKSSPLGHNLTKEDSSKEDGILISCGKRQAMDNTNSSPVHQLSHTDSIKDEHLTSSVGKRKSLRLEIMDTSSTKEDMNGENSLLSSTGKRRSIRRGTIDISQSKDLSPSIQELVDKEDSIQEEKMLSSPATKRKSIRRQTIDITPSSPAKTDSITTDNIVLNSDKRRSLRREPISMNNSAQKLDLTFDKTSSIETETKRKSQRLSVLPAEHKINTTFDKDVEKDSKTSLISSDNSISDKSDVSRISITSDDTVENIVNTTPLLVESSLDESEIKGNSIPNSSDIISPKVVSKISPNPQTPLKREGTFTKEGPEVQIQSPQTPGRRGSSVMPTAGCTPYHTSKSSQKKVPLNVTRSIEKRTSIDPAPRLTRVMFCSPVDNPAALAQEKRKIIKSNLKGSNKSFVFEETVSSPRPARKRSYTQSDADDTRAKRTRLTEDMQHSVDRLSRPRTTSATAKLTDSTPKKLTTPLKSKSESKPGRTRLPNFAALHQKQFDKMESLNECQERKAKRAKQMLTPNGPTNMLDRISPKNNTEAQKPVANPVKPKEKSDTPTKKLPTLESLRPGFTRFGFKLNLDINPFSVPPKNDKPKEKINGIVPKPAALPSLTGATSTRRLVAAKQAVMREKSFIEKRNLNRNENRTIIKGVRTNRRFELQMKLRNIE